MMTREEDHHLPLIKSVGLTACIKTHNNNIGVTITKKKLIKISLSSLIHVNIKLLCQDNKEDYFTVENNTNFKGNN